MASEQLNYSSDIQPSFIQVGPLSAFTAESVDILREADRQILEGKDLRDKSKYLMKESIENAKNMNRIVNDAFLRKLEDTLLLSVGIIEII